MTIKQQKAAARREVSTRVAALHPADRAAQEAVLVDRLTTLPGFAEAATVLLFASAFADEVHTGPMLRRVLDAGKRLACPRIAVGVKGRLDLFEVADPARDLAPGFWSIPEPAPHCRPVAPDEVGWALVPGVAFDRAGFRLGRGGGFYDRLLPRLRPDAGRWTLILDAQWVKEVPREPHDRPVDGVADHRGTWAAARTDFSPGS